MPISYADIIRKNAPMTMQRNMSGDFQTSPTESPVANPMDQISQMNNPQYRFPGPIADILRNAFAKKFELKTGNQPDMSGRMPVVDYFRNRFGLGLQGPQSLQAKQNKTGGV